MNFKIYIILLTNMCFVKGGVRKNNIKALKKPPMITTRIVGGYVTTIQEVGGFLVAMRNKGKFRCGGSLITERLVVSAAHCVDTILNNFAELTIEGGISSLNDNVNRVGVEKITIPPKFTTKTFHNDVAVLKLKKALVGKDIKTIELCTIGPKEGDVVIVSGWGTNKSGGVHVNEVYSVEVPIVNKDQCTKAYKKSNKITESMLCAGIMGEKDACTGDSGGPLVFKGELCGIVSFGIGCAHKNYPGVYTDVRAVTEFIKNAMKA